MTLKSEILEYLIEHDGNKDSVDVAHEFSRKYNLTVDIPLMELSKLEKEGKIKRVYYSFCRSGYQIL